MPNGDEFNIRSSQFNPPKKLSQLRQGSKASFYIRPDIKLPPEPCGATHINDNPNLNIIGKPGRQFGETVLYDPIQTKNYLSISERYERSLYEVVAKIEERGKKTVYFFCSSTSPSGYWEVEVGGGATYLTFTNPILTIICPRPFRLLDLTGIDTDAEYISYEQLQGRITIISPLTGDGSLNPVISIIGVPSDTVPPILIKADADGGATVTDTLLIYTSPTSPYSGNSFSAVGEIPNPCYFPIVEFAPLTPNTITKYAGQSLPITWQDPICDRDRVVKYILLVNTTRSYLPVAEFDLDDIRLTTLQPNTHYRLQTIFEAEGRQSAITGDLIYLPSPTPGYINLFADDAKGAIAFTPVESRYTRVQPPTVRELEYFDEYTRSRSFNFVESAYERIVITTQVLEETDEYTRSRSFAFVESSYTKLDIGGVVIG